MLRWQIGIVVNTLTAQIMKKLLRHINKYTKLYGEDDALKASAKVSLLNFLDMDLV